MTEAVFDFADIKRRMDRKPEEPSKLAESACHPMVGAPYNPPLKDCNKKAFSDYAAQAMASKANGFGYPAGDSFGSYDRTRTMSVASLRAHLDATKSNQIEDDGWITLWAY